MEEKNYYDWLEISKKASPEVIEKAYKALVKKYHPDLQEGDKSEAEEIIKKINEAYDVLSDPIKKADYDATLVDESVSQEDYDKLQQELNNLKHNINDDSYQDYTQTNNDYYEQPLNDQNNYYQNNNSQAQADANYQRQLEELEYQRQVEDARQKAYHDAYVQDLRNRGYKIRYKKSFKDYVRIVITVIIIILVLFALYQLPFVKNWLNDLYNNNEFFRFIADTFNNIFGGLFKSFKH